MSVEEQMAAELAALTGSPLSLDDNGGLAMTVGEETVFACYDEENSDWVVSCVVHEAAEGTVLGDDILRRALAANLLGIETGRLFLGLYGQSLVLAGRYPVAGMKAEDLGGDILAVVGMLPKLRARILGDGGEEPVADIPAANGLAGAIRV